MEKKLQFEDAVNPSSGGRGAYLLHLADNALILGHRNSEWCGHGPVLEQDIAITNISLDLIGQARNFYQYAALLINKSKNPEGSKAPSSSVIASGANPVIASGAKQEVTEDSLAYLRDAHEFKNCLLVELPKGDWAATILRQFFFSNYQYLLYGQLQNHKDEQIAAIAAKALKEVTYHLRWSSEWVIRLGDGTEESRKRILKAIDELWPYTEELFLPADYEKEAGIDPSSIKEEWLKKVNEIFEEATLPFSSVIASKAKQVIASEANPVIASGAKQGKHSKHLDDILADLQFLQRAYQNSQW